MEWLAYIDTILWCVALVVFLIIEISTFNLITVWFGLGSLVNVLLTLIKVEGKSFISPLWQVVIFLVVSIASVFLFMPMLKKKVAKDRVNTNVDAMAGKDGVVTMKIGAKSTGQIKVDGQIWTAVEENSGEILEGKDVIVIEIKGVKAVVKKK